MNTVKDNQNRELNNDELVINFKRLVLAQLKKNNNGVTVPVQNKILNDLSEFFDGLRKENYRVSLSGPSGHFYSAVEIIRNN